MSCVICYHTHLQLTLSAKLTSRHSPPLSAVTLTCKSTQHNSNLSKYNPGNFIGCCNLFTIWNLVILPNLHFCSSRNCSITTITVQPNVNMASCRELSKLTTDMNTIPSNCRPSRNGQGICNMSQHPMEYTALQSDQQHTPVNTLLSRQMLTTSDPNQDSLPTDTPSSQRQVESFTPCVRKNDRFVDPSGKPLQPGTVIICNKIPFVVSNNGRMYNFTGGSFKQLYVADPSKHKFLVFLANSPSTFSSIINSVISLLPRLGCKTKQY